MKEKYSGTTATDYENMYGQKFGIKYDKTPFMEFFKSDKNVICAIVFGSSINGTIKSGSDLK